MFHLQSLGRCLATCFGTVSIAAAAATSPPTFYFSDCQVGAANDCVAGNDANAGTDVNRPRRSVAGFNVNALPAGARLLFARGGSWTGFRLQVVNLNATPASPIVFDAYGSGAVPLLNTPSHIGFEFGKYNEFEQDGGYILRNLKLDGMGTGLWGVFLRSDLRNVTVENVEITGFEVGIHAQGTGPLGITEVTIRNSNLHHNRQHGMLATANNMLLEGNMVANNNMDGGGREHGIYLSGGRNVVVRNNTFANNSAPGGVCDGGNLTLHGQMENFLIEGNTVTQAAAKPGCYGMSITAAYSTPEFFRNFVVRNNTFINVGICALCLSSAPDVVIEGNRIYNMQATGQIGVLIPAIRPGPGDAADGGAVIRDNIVCFSAPGAGSEAVRAPSAGTVTGNVYRTGAAATNGACAR